MAGSSSFALPPSITSSSPMASPLLSSSGAPLPLYVGTAPPRHIWPRLVPRGTEFSEYLATAPPDVSSDAAATVGAYLQETLATIHLDRVNHQASAHRSRRRLNEFRGQLERLEEARQNLVDETDRARRDAARAESECVHMVSELNSSRQSLRASQASMADLQNSLDSEHEIRAQAVERQRATAMKLSETQMDLESAETKVAGLTRKLARSAADLEESENQTAAAKRALVSLKTSTDADLAQQVDSAMSERVASLLADCEARTGEVERLQFEAASRASVEESLRDEWEATQRELASVREKLADVLGNEANADQYRKQWENAKLEIESLGKQLDTNQRELAEAFAEAQSKEDERASAQAELASANTRGLALVNRAEEAELRAHEAERALLEAAKGRFPHGPRQASPTPPVVRLSEYCLIPDPNEPRTVTAGAGRGAGTARPVSAPPPGSSTAPGTRGGPPMPDLFGTGDSAAAPAAAGHTASQWGERTDFDLPDLFPDNVSEAPSLASVQADSKARGFLTWLDMPTDDKMYYFRNCTSYHRAAIRQVAEMQESVTGKEVYRRYLCTKANIVARCQGELSPDTRARGTALTDIGRFQFNKKLSDRDHMVATEAWRGSRRTVAVMCRDALASGMPFDMLLTKLLSTADNPQRGDTRFCHNIEVLMRDKVLCNFPELALDVLLYSIDTSLMPRELSSNNETEWKLLKSRGTYDLMTLASKVEEAYMLKLNDSTLTLDELYSSRDHRTNLFNKYISVVRNDSEDPTLGEYLAQIFKEAWDEMQANLDAGMMPSVPYLTLDLIIKLKVKPKEGNYPTHKRNAARSKPRAAAAAAVHDADDTDTEASDVAAAAAEATRLRQDQSRRDRQRHADIQAAALAAAADASGSHRGKGGAKGKGGPRPTSDLPEPPAPGSRGRGSGGRGGGGGRFGGGREEPPPSGNDHGPASLPAGQSAHGRDCPPPTGSTGCPDGGQWSQDKWNHTVVDFDKIKEEMVGTRAAAAVALAFPTDETMSEPREGRPAQDWRVDKVWQAGACAYCALRPRAPPGTPRNEQWWFGHGDGAHSPYGCRCLKRFLAEGGDTDAYPQYCTHLQRMLKLRTA